MWRAFWCQEGQGKEISHPSQKARPQWKLGPSPHIANYGTPNSLCCTYILSTAPLPYQFIKYYILYFRNVTPPPLWITAPVLLSQTSFYLWNSFTLQHWSGHDNAQICFRRLDTTTITTITTITSPSTTTSWSLVSGILNNWINSLISITVTFPPVDFNFTTHTVEHQVLLIPTHQSGILYILVLTNQICWSYDVPTSPCKTHISIFYLQYSTQQNMCHSQSNQRRCQQMVVHNRWWCMLSMCQYAHNH